jgi:hypothetical protein
MSRKRVVLVRICSAADVGQKSCNVRAALSLRLESPYGRLIIRTLVQWIPAADGMKVRGEFDVFLSDRAKSSSVHKQDQPEE